MAQAGGPNGAAADARFRGDQEAGEAGVARVSRPHARWRRDRAASRVSPDAARAAAPSRLTPSPSSGSRRSCRGSRWSRATSGRGRRGAARSLVMKPASTVSTQTFSSVVGELRELGVVVELGAMREAARPGEDRGDRVGRGLLALLVLAVVARHGAVRGLRFDRSCRPASSAPRSSGRASRSPAPRCRTARRRRSSCRPRHSRPTTSAPTPPCRRSGGARR